MIIVYGFFVDIIYSTFLGSFFVKDFQGIPIVCPSLYMKNPDIHLKNFKVVSFQIFWNALLAMNTSFGYCTIPPLVEYFHRNPDNIFFRMDASIEIIAQKPFHFFSERDSGLADSYNQFLLMVYSSGIINFWGSGFGRMHISKSLKKVEQNYVEDLGLTLDEFQMLLFHY